MSTFSTLYKRTKTGAVQQWTISVEVENTWSAKIIKEAGQLGGKLTRHVEHITVGKNLGKSNETTPEQQAQLQAQSDWTRKHDEGYKTAADLGVHVQATHCRVDGQEKSFTLIEALDLMLPEFNTDASGNMKPMKAPTKPWVANGKTTYPKQIERKLDGCRSFLNVNGLKATFTSTSGKPYDTLQHLVVIIEDHLKKIDNKAAYTLDGEIYRHGWVLEDINKALKKQRPETLELQFWLFDAPFIGRDMQRTRTALVTLIAKEINSPFICTGSPSIVNSDEEVIKYHDEICIAHEFEGAMLKDLNGTYQPGQRSSYWTKVKMFDDAEFEVLDFELGQRGTEDLLIKCKLVDGSYDKEHGDGTFLVKMTGSRESKQEHWDNKANIIGKIPLTVKFFGYSKYGVPNLPTGKAFRDE